MAGENNLLIQPITVKAAVVHCPKKNFLIFKIFTVANRQP